MEKTETRKPQSSQEIQAAYQKLAEGIVAVMELESTDVHIFDMLTELSTEMWNCGPNRDRAGVVRAQLAHVAEFKARHAHE